MPAVLRRPGHNCLVWLVAAILGLCRADTSSADVLLCSVQVRQEARHLQGLRQSTGAHLNSHSGDRQANNRCSRRSHGHTSWFLTIGPQASVAGKPNQCWKVPTPTWETKLWTVAPPPSFQPCREFMDQNKPKSTVKKSTHPLTETHMGNTVPEANATELFLSFDHRRFPHRPRLQRLGHGHPPTTAKPTPTPTGPPTKFTLLNKLFPGHLCGQEILGASPKMLAHVLGNRTGRVKTCEEAGATSSKMPPLNSSQVQTGTGASERVTQTSCYGEEPSMCHQPYTTNANNAKLLGDVRRQSSWAGVRGPRASELLAKLTARGIEARGH